MAVRGSGSTRDQGKPCSSLPVRGMMAVMIVLLLFPALALVTVSLVRQPDGALKREPDRVHARLTRVKIIPADNVDGEGEITEEETYKRRHSRNVRARRLQTLVSDGECNTMATIFRLAVSRRMGPSNDPARLPGRSVKLFIICASSGLKKVKKVGMRAALVSPREAPANQHVVQVGNNHRRRALKQLPQFQVPPLPFTLPSVALLSPPASPQLRIPLLPQLRFPPLPFSSPASPQLQNRPPSITFPQIPSPFFNFPTSPVSLPTPVSAVPKHLNLPPLPFHIPPLPFQIPPLPCEPSPSGKSLPPP